MENTADKNINVRAYYFRNNGARLNGFPKKIEIDGKIIEFIDNGLQRLVEKGQRIVQVFDMTDGLSNYQLEFDDDKNDWKLTNLAGSA